MKVGVFDLPPFAIKSNVVYGLHVDFIKETLKKAEVDYELVFLPYARLVKRLKDNKVDLALLFKRNDLKNSIELTKSIGFENLIISHKDNPINSIKELEGKSIAIIHEAKYEHAFDVNPKIKKINIQKYEQSFEMLYLKRIDGFIIPRPAYRFLKMKDKESHFSKPIILNTKYNYFYINKSISKKIRDRISQANKKLIQEEYLNKIMLKYDLD